MRDQFFDAETTVEMSAAFLAVCARLGLTARQDQATELVAEKIIEIAQSGVRTRATLALLALKEFKEGK